MNYSEAIEWLYSTQLFGIKLGLDSPKRLLREYLAYPKSQTQVAHVAGTNGKGSTSAILDSIARASGLRSGLFTSPHLVDFRERIQINGEMICEEETATHITAIRDLVKDWDHHPTFFEITLAIGMRHFRDNDCDVLVLETGMGGRLDATTAVPADIAILTPIGLDHTQWLGETYEEVAGEKAGIIMNKKPVVSAQQKPAAMHVIEQEANEQRAKLTVVTEPLVGYNINLLGEYQKENAALALEAAHQLGFTLNYDTVKRAMNSVIWGGRFEVTSESPLVVIDGAHNPHAAEMLVKTWQENFPDQRPVIIYGAIESKDLEGVWQHLIQISSDVIFTPVNSPRTVTYEQVADLKTLEDTKVIKKLSMAESLSFAQKLDRPILVCGSLYLLGEYKAINASHAHRSTSQ